jgi:hypothetical protein
MRTATHQPSRRQQAAVPLLAGDAGKQAFWILRAAFTAAPIASGWTSSSAS